MIFKECKLTNAQARAIFYACYKSRKFTFPMMRTMRKSFAYAFELIGAGKPRGNFPGVNDVWSIIRLDQLPDNITTTIPDRIPQPEEIKVAFTRGWTPDHPWCLMQFLGGMVAGHDWGIFGLRSREDIESIALLFALRA